MQVCRILMISAFVFFITPSLLAQWSTSGTNIYNSNSGNVGIGTSGPTFPFHVVGSVNDLIGLTASGVGRGGIYIQNTSPRGLATLTMENDHGNLGSWTQFAIGGSNNAWLTAFGLSPTDKVNLLAGGPYNTGMAVGTMTAQPLVLGTNNAERMRIDGSGNVGIGTTTPTAPVQINSSANEILSIIASGPLRGGYYVQNTNSAGHADVLIENDHGSFASYAVFAIGGSTNTYPSVFGLSRVDRPYLVAGAAVNIRDG
jgi:hypothetical protein